MGHSWGHFPPNGNPAEAKLWFSKKTWLLARCEGREREKMREKKRKVL